MSIEGTIYEALLLSEDERQEEADYDEAWRNAVAYLVLSEGLSVSAAEKRLETGCKLVREETRTVLNEWLTSL